MSRSDAAFGVRERAVAAVVTGRRGPRLPCRRKGCSVGCRGAHSPARSTRGFSPSSGHPSRAPVVSSNEKRLRCNESLAEALVPNRSSIREHLEGYTILRGRIPAPSGVEALLFDRNPRAAYRDALGLDMTYEATIKTTPSSASNIAPVSEKICASTICYTPALHFFSGKARRAPPHLPSGRSHTEPDPFGAFFPFAMARVVARERGRRHHPSSPTRRVFGVEHGRNHSRP
jgi:hypothetical protein